MARDMRGTSVMVAVVSPVRPLGSGCQGELRSASVPVRLGKPEPPSERGGEQPAGAPPAGPVRPGGEGEEVEAYLITTGVDQPILRDPGCDVGGVQGHRVLLD